MNCFLILSLGAASAVLAADPAPPVAESPDNSPWFYLFRGLVVLALLFGALKGRRTRKQP